MKLTATCGSKQVFIGMDISFNTNSTVTIGMVLSVQQALVCLMILLWPILQMSHNTCLNYAMTILSWIMGKKISQFSLCYYMSLGNLAWTKLQLYSFAPSFHHLSGWLKEVKHVLQYLCNTCDDNLTIGGEEIECLQCFADASYAVHAEWWIILEELCLRALVF